MVGVQNTLCRAGKFESLCRLTCNGTKYLLIKSTTAVLGYVTAPSVLQPVQVGTKKSIRICFPDAFASLVTSSKSFPHVIVGEAPLASAAITRIRDIANADK